MFQSLIIKLDPGASRTVEAEPRVGKPSTDVAVHDGGKYNKQGSADVDED
jgi:hypothetical protein